MRAVLGLCVAGGLWLSGGPEQETGKRELAEAVLQRAEEESRHPFAPAFREAALQALLALPAEELEARKEKEEGGVGPLAVGDSRAQLVYTPVTPCRIIDTRVAGGSLAVGGPRSFRVTGTGLETQGGSTTGCAVPFGPATAAVINFVAVNPVGPGNLRAWAYRYPWPPPPAASVLNYAAISGLNLANAIVIPMCDPAEAGQACPYDIRAQADGSGTHLVADVVGYFERFPKEQVRSFSVTAANPGTAPAVIQASCTVVSSAEVFVNAPVAGVVVMRGVVRGQIEHAQGAADSMSFGITAAPASCAFQVPSTETVAAMQPGDTYPFSAPVLATFAVTPGTHRFHLSGQMAAGSSFNDQITGWFLEATFQPQ